MPNQAPDRGGAPRRRALGEADLPFVLTLKPAKGGWAPRDDPPPPDEAARRLPCTDAAPPDDWTALARGFRDGHQASWGAADLRLGGDGPDQSVRLIVATTAPATLLSLSTRYLTTNLPRPGSLQAAASVFPPANLAEVVRLYPLGKWVEQGYEQAKPELGADFQVRSDQAIRRHWLLVWCAFRFCWPHGRDPLPQTEGPPAGEHLPAEPRPPPTADAGGKSATATRAPAAVVRDAKLSWARALRCGRAGSKAPRPPDLQALPHFLGLGRPLTLSLRH